MKRHNLLHFLRAEYHTVRWEAATGRVLVRGNSGGGFPYTVEIRDTSLHWYPTGTGKRSPLAIRLPLSSLNDLPDAMEHLLLITDTADDHAPDLCALIASLSTP